MLKKDVLRPSKLCVMHFIYKQIAT